MNRSNIARALIAAAGLLYLGGADAADVKFRLGYNPASDFLAAFVAKDQKLFEKHGLDPEFIFIPSQQAIVSALPSGSADIGGVTPITILLADEAGIPLRVIASADVLPTKAKYGILARTGSNIKTAKDLVGKRVGLPGLKAMLHLIGQRWMLENGVKGTDVTFVEMPFAQQSDLLRAGQIDAVLTADPFYTRIVDQKTGYEFDDIYKTVPDGTLLAAYIASARWVDANPGAAKAFRAALQDAIDIIGKDEKLARESLARWTKMPPDVLDKTAIPTFEVNVTPKQIQWFIDTAKAEGMIDGTSVAERLAAQ